MLNIFSEDQLEQSWIKELCSPNIKWTYREDLSNKDIDILVNNFKTNIEKRHKIKFTDQDWSKFCFDLDKSFIKQMQLLREPINFVFKDNTKTDILLIDWNDPNNNSYEVVNQITDGHHRYDVSLLINGLPIFHCELKKPGYVDIWQAFHQIKRYKKEKMHWLYGFLNIFCISDGISSMLFANNDNISEKYPHFWSNESNNKIGNLNKLSECLLKPDSLLELINKFTLLTNNELILTRPYQYHAIKICMNHCLTTKDSGYVFHATGSGKTLTSYLLCRDLSRNEKIDKVLFIIDRNDLGVQTTENFSKYASGGSKTNIKYDVDNTQDLINKLNDKNAKLVITSIQKLDNAIKNANKNELNKKIKNQKIIFVYDECHRSQAGDMRRHIDNFFEKPQTIGFTGTPIYEPYQTASGLKTADIFGECLHTYSILNSVSDNNTVPYLISYLGSYKLIKEENDKLATSLDWESFYKSDKWINAVCQYISKTIMDLTQSYKYGAMLTVSSIDEAYKCWKTIKQIMPDIRIGCVFSIDPNGEETGEDNKSSKERLLEIIQSYNKEFQCSYDLTKYYAYQKNLADKIKNGKINLTIVVNVFTTGFDAPILNTLYVARELKMHGLIQTFARICRTFDKKQHGNIKCLLRTNPKNVYEAFSYYAKGVEINKCIPIVAKDYKTIVNSINDILKQLKQIAPAPSDALNIQSETDTAIFMKNVRNLAFDIDNFFVCLDEHNWNDLICSYDIIQEYRSIAGSLLNKYKQIVANSIKINPEPYVDITFDDLVNRTQISTIDWMNKISRSKTKLDRSNILRQLVQELSKANLRPVSELIKEFLEWFLEKYPESTESDTRQALDDKIEQIWNEKLEQLAKKYQLDYEFVKVHYRKYKDNILTKQEKDIFKQQIKNTNSLSFQEFDKAFLEILDVFERIKNEEFFYNQFNW